MIVYDVLSNEKSSVYDMPPIFIIIYEKQIKYVWEK